MNTAIATRNSSPAHACWAGLLALAILLLPALAALPTLHDHVHEEAADSDHQCAVTLFAKGQIDIAETSLPVQLPVQTAPKLSSRSAIFLQAPDYLFSQGRSPPALFS